MDTVAKSYVNNTALSAGAAAETASKRKTEKYRNLSETYTFLPIAIETFGPINHEGADFLSTLGGQIFSLTRDNREHSFLLQRISIAIQRFNAVCIRGTFVSASDCD